MQRARTGAAAKTGRANRRWHHQMAKSASHKVCIILAGGRGQRMASRRQHKVCFPVVGRPAIVRAIDTYKQAGLRRFLVVVGQMAEQVIATVATAHADVTFVYQEAPRGTGHAALVAAEALARQDFQGGAMVVMGDKVTRPRIVRRLLEHFAQTAADVVISTLPKQPRSTAGRVITGTGARILGTVELAEIQRAKRSGKKILLNGRPFTAGELEKRGRTVNASMYCFRFPATVTSVLCTISWEAELHFRVKLHNLAQTNHSIYPHRQLRHCSRHKT